MNPAESFKWLLFIWITCDSECMKLCTSEDSSPKEYDSMEFEECDCKGACIRTCCKPGYHFADLVCNFDNSSKLVISVYGNKTEFVRTTNKGFSVGILECSDSMIRLNQSDPEDAVYLQEDGSLWYPSDDKFVPNNKYCIGGSGSRNDTFLCLDQLSEYVNREINTVGMMISMPFLLATFMIYYLIPNKNLNKKALMVYVLSLFLGDLILVAIDLSDYIEHIPCVTLGFLLLLFFLVSFCWMNVICLDIWLSFRSLTRSIGRRSHSEHREFWIYSIYAWGLPILFTSAVVLLNQFLDSESEYHPKIGSVKCFIQEGYPKLLYFYAPISVILVVNILLFVMTAIKIRMVNKSTGTLLNQRDSRCHSINENKQKFSKYTKLMFAMGINWIMEVISFISNWQFEDSIPSEVWYLTDLCNALYGVIIFFTMVFQKSVFNMLSAQYLQKKIPCTPTTTPSLQSISSQA